MREVQLSEHSQRAVTRFEVGPTITDRANALTDLLNEKALTKAARLPAFRVGMEALVRSATSPDNQLGRLHALAQLARISQAARGLTSDVAGTAKPALVHELPPASLAKDAEERWYIAKALAWADGDWVLPYSLRAIASEPPTADKVRAEFMAVAFSRASDLASLFAGLRDAFCNERPDTEAPADSLAKRLAKALAALREEVVNSRLPSGSEVGKRFGEITSKSLGSLGMPSEDGTRVSLARELVLGTYDLVRTRFSLSTDADTYTALRYAKRLVGSGSWPKELRPDLDLLAASLLESLLLIAKQGLMPQSLREYLELAVNYRERADALLRSLADDHPELDEKVRAWLRGVRTVAASASTTLVNESQELRSDPLLAEALLDAGQAEEALSSLVAIVSAVRGLDPARASELEGMADRVRAYIRSVRELAQSRRIGILGSVGADIDYAPKYFALTGAVSRPRMRVVRPAVIRVERDASPGEVIVKGLVE